MKVFDDDGTELIKCQYCINGILWTECCNGSRGCGCHGQPVDLGSCRVCNGTGWHKPGINTKANLEFIRRLVVAGGGYLF